MSPTVDTKDIAEMLGLTRLHVTDRLVKEPDFPAPVIHVSRKIRRWDAAQVRAWAARAPEPEAQAEYTWEAPAKPFTFRQALAKKLAGAQRRSRIKGRPCPITLLELMAMYEEQGGKCAVSRIPFAIEPGEDGPFAPTIDRIECSKGYETGNIRIVCLSVNLMMNKWGDSVFHEFVQELRK